MDVVERVIQNDKPNILNDILNAFPSLNKEVGILKIFIENVSRGNYDIEDLFTGTSADKLGVAGLINDTIDRIYAVLNDANYEKMDKWDEENDRLVDLVNAFRKAKRNR